MAYSFLHYSIGAHELLLVQGREQGKAPARPKTIRAAKSSRLCVRDFFSFSWPFLTANSRFCGCTTADSYI